ncbi:hypothetical protein spd_00005 [Shewanella phage Dolos]|nr:hypothetical protein spd_00005 [Shewanella phage Dolos]
MAFSPFGTHRLRPTYILLTALLCCSPAFAYTPPATPNVPLSFEFLGSTAQAESIAFYNTQCDSDNYSWYGTSWACATGDPANPVCIVEMAYHSTDVNQCTGYIPPTLPDLELTPDATQEGTGDNQNLIRKLEKMYLQDFNKNYEDGLYQDSSLALSRQTNSLLNSLSRTLSYANDNRSIVDAIDRWGATLQVNAQNVWQTQQEFWANRHRLEDFNFDNYLGGISGQLSALDQIAANTAGGGGGSGSFPDEAVTYLDRIQSNTNTLKNSFAGFNSMASALMPEQNNLLRQIDASIKALDLGQGGGDSSAVVDSLTNTNQLLTDIKNSIGSTVSQVGCESFTCSSNSAQCYIARKEWENRCKTTSDELTTKNSLDSAQSNITDFINSPDSDIKNIEAGTVDIKQFTNHYNSSNGVNFGGSDTCPPPYTIDAKITTFTLDLTPFCDLATVIKFFLIAFASVASGLMIVKYH